nr:hypothetical protein RF2 [Helanthium bolivianum]
MKKHPFKSWIFELRKMKNSHYFLDSWIKFDSVGGSFTSVFFNQERFMKLFDPRVLSILLSRDSQGSRSNPYFMIKGVVLLVVVVLISGINNRKMVERKNLYLTELLPIPIPMNSIESRNETWEDSLRSFNIKKFPFSLLWKRISESCFMDPQESTWVLPINQKWIMPEFNRGSRWWRNQIGRDSSCKISNETIAGIEISFKEKDSKYMEFLFLSYLVNEDPFFSRVRNVSSNMEYDSTRSIFTDSSQLKGSSDQSRDHFDSITNEDSSPLSDILSELHLRPNPTERSTRDQKFWKKKKQDVSFVPFRQSENQAMVDLFKIIPYLQNTVSIHPISSDPGWYMVPKDEPDIDNKISLLDREISLLDREILFLKRNPFWFWGSFRLFPTRWGGYRLGHDLESELEWDEMADRFTLSIIEPVYHRGFAFSMDSYGLGQKKFGVFNSRDESKKKSLLVLPPLFYEESKKKSLLVLPPLFYEENESFYRRIRKKLVRIHCGNDLEDPKVLFASNNIMETFNQYRLIRNLIQIQYSAWGYIRNVSNRFFLMVMNRFFEYGIPRDEIGNDTLNPITIMKYTINQHLLNLKKSQKKWFDPLISRTERSTNRAYTYKWCKQRKPFQQVAFDRLQVGFHKLQVRLQVRLQVVFGVFHRLQVGFHQLQVGFHQLQVGFHQLQVGFHQLQVGFHQLQVGFHQLQVRLQVGFHQLQVRLQVGFHQLQVGFHQLQVGFHQLQVGFHQLQVGFARIYHEEDVGVNTNYLRWRRLRGLLAHHLRTKTLPFLYNYKYKSLLLSIIFSIKRSFFLFKSIPFVSFRNTPCHRAEIHFYECEPKDPNDQQLSELIRGQIVPKLKPFLLNDPGSSQRPKFFIDGGTIFPLLFNKIPKSMVDSFHTRNNRRESFDNTDSYFSMIAHDRDNWLNPVKPFHRSSLISSFYKANRLRFLNNPRHFWFYCNKGFPFYVEKTRINNYDLTYGQFLNILFIRNKIFSLCVGKKKDICLERETISPIDLQVSDIFIPKDFPQSGEETYNLYKSFHFPIRFEPFVRRAIYPIADISATPRTEEQIVNLERTYGPLFSEGKNLQQDLRSLCSEKDFSSAKRRKRSRKKWETYRTLKEDSSNLDSVFSNLYSAFSNLYSAFLLKRNLFLKWNLFQISRSSVQRYISYIQNIQRYMPLFCTSTGFKYLKFILLDTLSNRLRILLSPKLKSLSYDIMDKLNVSRLILQTKLWAIHTQWKNLISEILSKKDLRGKVSRRCNLVLYEEMYHLEDGSPPSLVWSGLIYWELFSSIFFFLLVAGYFVHRHLISISRLSIALHTELANIKSLMIPSYMIEVQKLLDRYPPSERFWLTNLFLVAWEELGDSLRQIRVFVGNRNLIDLIISIALKPANLISIIPNPINRIAFSINTRHLSRTSKEIYSLISKRRMQIVVLNGNGTEDKMKSCSIALGPKIQEELFQFLRTEKRIDQILWSLTHSDLLGKYDSGYQKDDSGYQMIEEPGLIYLRSLVDIHQRDLINYEFNRSCLAERRIFLAHYQAITYLQTSPAANNLRFPSHAHGKLFSFRLALSPPRGILVLGSIGTGRSYLVKYLATNSYVPFITVFSSPEPPKSEPIPFSMYGGGAAVLGGSSSDNSEPKGPELPPFPHLPSLNMDSNDMYMDDRLFMDTFALWVFIDSYKEFEKKAEDWLDDRPNVREQFRFIEKESMSTCIIWIPDIHNLCMKRDASERFSFALLVNLLSRNWKRWSTRNILVIASTHIPRKVDPVLLGPNQLSTCIKIRRPPIPQQRKHFCILSYTRGFHWDHKMFHTKGLESRTLGSDGQDILALSNEALSISITQKKSILESNTIELALHRQTWHFRSHGGSVRDHGILFYQIGRAVAHNVLLSTCPPDPISIYMKRIFSLEKNSDLSKWYFELGKSMKKLTILLYLFSCSAGSVARDLWSPLGLDEKNGIASSRFLETESNLVHGLLEVEGALVGSSRTEKDCSQFDNNRVTLFLRSEPRNPLDRMQNGFCSIKDSEKGEGFDSKEQLEKDFSNQIVWAPRIWCPQGNEFEWIERPDELGFPYLARAFRGKRILYDKYKKYDKKGELQENDSKFLESGRARHWARDRFRTEQAFFQQGKFLWEPADPFFFLFKDGFVFSRREFFADEEMLRALLTFHPEPPKVGYESVFVKNTQEKHLIHRQRRLRTNSSLYKESFRSNIRFESYQYLSKLFLSNGRLLDQMIKTLLRKKWLFPDDLNHVIHVTGERFPIP